MVDITVPNPVMHINNRFVVLNDYELCETYKHPYVLMYLFARVGKGNLRVSRNALRRLTKRLGLSTRDIRAWLLEFGFVTPPREGDYPLQIEPGTLCNFQTFDQWKDAGYMVIKGSKSIARDIDTKEALFTRWQVDAIV